MKLERTCLTEGPGALSKVWEAVIAEGRTRTHCMLRWAIALGGAWWRIRRHGTGRTDGSSESESQEGKPSLASEAEDKYQRNLEESPFRSLLKGHLIR